MVDLRQFPDCEALVGEAIRDAVTEAGARVYSSIPKSPTFPLITVKRIGGLPVEKHSVDQANIQIDVWGTTKSEAYDVAQQARAAILRMEGTAPTGAVIAGVTDALGMTWQPDAATARDRYIFGVLIVLRAAA